MLYALAAVSVGWKVLLLGVGTTLPRLLIDDGLRTIPLDLQPYGAQALTTARAMWGGPIERHGVRTVRLLRVERLSDASAARCGGLSAHVRAYTFFAIPYSEVRTICDRGTVEYRGIPHRARAD